MHKLGPVATPNEKMIPSGSASGSAARLITSARYVPPPASTSSWTHNAYPTAIRRARKARADGPTCAGQASVPRAFPRERVLTRIPLQGSDPARPESVCTQRDEPSAGSRRLVRDDLVKFFTKSPGHPGTTLQGEGHVGHHERARPVRGTGRRQSFDCACH